MDHFWSTGFGKIYSEFMSRCVLNIPKNVDFGSSVPDEGALLQQLSAQIQWDVLTVHHTCTHTSEVKKISVFFLFIKKLHVKAAAAGGGTQVDADLGGSAAIWAEYRWLWSGSGPSCCTEPHWSPSPCSRRTCSASVDR